MKNLMLGAALTTAALLSGCATVFNGSAPAGNGDSIYVAGSYKGFFGPQTGKVWRCPAMTKGKCQQITVTFE